MSFPLVSALDCSFLLLFTVASVEAALALILLASNSKALSLSILSAYFLTNFDWVLIRVISSSLKISILLSGARNSVAANGVGVPFSLKAVTKASPMPKLVSSSSVL